MADDRTSTGVGFAYPAWNSILGRDDLLNLFALRALIYRLAGDWDACAARSKVGPVMGLRPLRGPPCIPPEAPPKKIFRFLRTARARGSSCGSFLPSLRSVR